MYLHHELATSYFHPAMFLDAETKWAEARLSIISRENQRCGQVKVYGSHQVSVMMVAITQNLSSQRGALDVC